MARYIRTKDSVYDGEKYNADYILDYELGKILKQSENLEELCDLVRFKTKDNATHYIDLHKNTIEDIVVHFGGKNIIIDSFRYCIETDKGLIYVAKMDNEGKLVLI